MILKYLKPEKSKIRKLNIVKAMYKGKIREWNIPLLSVLPQQLHHHHSISFSQYYQLLGNS